MFDFLLFKRGDRMILCPQSGKAKKFVKLEKGLIGADITDLDPVEFFTHLPDELTIGGDHLNIADSQVGTITLE